MFGESPLAIPLSFERTKYPAIQDRMKCLIQNREEALAAHELVVFESPVWSGLFAKRGKTGTKTGPHKFKIPKRLNRTDRDRSNTVLVSLFRSWDQFNL